VQRGDGIAVVERLGRPSDHELVKNRRKGMNVDLAEVRSCLDMVLRTDMLRTVVALAAAVAAVAAVAVAVAVAVAG
jgi:hypothetical protein